MSSSDEISIERKEPNMNCKNKEDLSKLIDETSNSLQILIAIEKRLNSYLNGLNGINGTDSYAINETKRLNKDVIKLKQNVFDLQYEIIETRTYLYQIKIDIFDLSETTKICDDKIFKPLNVLIEMIELWVFEEEQLYNYVMSKEQLAELSNLSSVDEALTNHKHNKSKCRIL